MTKQAHRALKTRIEDIIHDTYEFPAVTYQSRLSSAILAAVYGALREPSEEMLRAGYNADISPPEATYFAMLSASALSVSPLQERDACGLRGLT